MPQSMDKRDWEREWGCRCSPKQRDCEKLEKNKQAYDKKNRLLIRGSRLLRITMRWLRLRTVVRAALPLSGWLAGWLAGSD